ncbi:MAG TPA: prepilin-type N-terminal cleavage/methylation domain-containing protein, partial [candidate division Zixibacteria bacterium]|nr:prepilin-type N-terminal cleavage/methylation domain-containing protein [candidate division Zixibacteria bacterium]
MCADGFTFIEVVVVIIILGALATIAVSGLESTLEASRQEETLSELDALTQGIIGDAALTDGAARGDFGFVGDVGALPNSLADLTSAPAGYGTWNGPYVRDDFVENAGDAVIDPWGAAYGYSGGVSIQSTGSGSTITKRFATTSADLTSTTVRGVIVDRSGAPPGADRMNVAVRITYPDGAGSVTSATVSPSASGLFVSAGIPIGRHLVEAVYTPTLDTALAFVTVRPRVGGFVEQLRFGSDYWGGGGPGGGGISEILRPDGPGAASTLVGGGCAANWECVDEVVADDSTTYVAGFGASWNNDS